MWLKKELISMAMPISISMSMVIPNTKTYNPQLATHNPLCFQKPSEAYFLKALHLCSCLSADRSMRLKKELILISMAISMAIVIPNLKSPIPIPKSQFPNLNSSISIPNTNPNPNPNPNSSIPIPQS